MISESVEIDCISNKLCSNQLEITHSGFRNLSQKSIDVNHSLICCEILDYVVSIGCFLVKGLGCCGWGRLLSLGAIERITPKFNLHVSHVKSQLYHNSTWVCHFIVNCVHLLVSFDPKGDTDILDIFRKESMNLINVGVSHGIRSAVNALFAYLTNFDVLCYG